MAAALTSGDATASHIAALVTSSTEARQAADIMNAESGSVGEQILKLDGEVKYFRSSGGQVSLYSRALAIATGRRSRDYWVHQPIAGTMTRVKIV